MEPITDTQKQKIIRAAMADWAETCIRSGWEPVIMIAFDGNDRVEFSSLLSGKQTRELLTKSLEAMPSDDELDKLRTDHYKKN